MSHDFTASPTKHATREQTFAVVRDSASFWNCLSGEPSACLKKNWLELTSIDDPTFQMLLDANALQPGKSCYIGVSNDPAVIEHNRAAFAAETKAGLAKWICANLEDILADLSFEPNVGVVVADGYMSVSNRNLRSSFGPIFNYVKARQPCHLVLNYVLRIRGGQTLDAEIVKYQQIVSEYVGENVPPESFYRYMTEKRHSAMMLCRVHFGI